MKIDLSAIDPTQFNVKDGVFCGQKAFLVTPSMQGTVWRQSNKHLRSSIWSETGELLSAGFPKFTNAGENPEHFPMPGSLLGSVCVEKLDGSLAIFDFVNGEFSCRTRGTFSYKALDNAKDFEHCMAKYPGIEKWCRYDSSYSLLCEITTPNQKIVIDYGPEPDLTLIGVIYKPGYVIFRQDTLDEVAEVIGLKRPRRFVFPSLDDCLTDVAKWEGLEGCVIYSGKDFHVMHKVKSSSYLRCHRFKSNATLPNVLDLWMAQSRPDFETFKASLIQQFDDECWKLVESFALSVTEAGYTLIKELAQLKSVIEPLRIQKRREAAAYIFANHKDLQGAAFKILDGRDLDDKTIRKLMETRLGL